MYVKETSLKPFEYDVIVCATWSTYPISYALQLVSTCWRTRHQKNRILEITFSWKRKERKLRAYLYLTTDARNVKEPTLLLSSLRNKESVISHLFTFEWCHFSDRSQIVWKNIFILRFARKATDDNAKNNVLIKFKKKASTHKLRKPLNHKEWAFSLTHL